eukprot:8179370-Pyramimonas_sp.AAC.1
MGVYPYVLRAAADVELESPHRAVGVRAYSTGGDRSDLTSPLRAGPHRAVPVMSIRVAPLRFSAPSC